MTRSVHTATPLGADPFRAASDAARQAAYAALAAAGPVVRIPLPAGGSGWLVTRPDDVRQVLADPRLRRPGPGGGPFAENLPDGLASALYRSMLAANPPDHGRLRRLLAAAFTRSSVEALTPRIRRIADDLLDALPADRPVDLLREFAYPLPMTVICELLGVPLELRPEFRACSRVLAAGTLAGREPYTAAARAMVEMLRELVDDRRRDPADDLLSALVAARDGVGGKGNDRLDEDELTSTAFLLLIAGHETTVNLIANGLRALLTQPGQLSLLQARPDLLSAAVEELLRYDGPVQVTLPLTATEPIEIGGVAIPAGDVVVPGLLVAHRDPARYAEPHRLDLTRVDGRHLAFGHGAHHCLGAPLARLEGRIALGTLVVHRPGLRLAVPDEELVRTPSFLMNGFAALPVLLGAPA
jgi:cytochrome P450